MRAAGSSDFYGGLRPLVMHSSPPSVSNNQKRSTWLWPFGQIPVRAILGHFWAVFRSFYTFWVQKKIGLTKKIRNNVEWKETSQDHSLFVKSQLSFAKWHIAEAAPHGIWVGPNWRKAPADHNTDWAEPPWFTSTERIACQLCERVGKAKNDAVEEEQRRNNELVKSSLWA